MAFNWGFESISIQNGRTYTHFAHINHINTGWNVSIALNIDCFNDRWVLWYTMENTHQLQSKTIINSNSYVYTHTHTHTHTIATESLYEWVRVYYEIESCKLVFMHGCWINWAKAVHTWMRFRESNHYHLRQFVGSRTYKCVHKSLPGKNIHFELNCKLLSSIWRRILMKSSLYNVYGWKMTLKPYISSTE